MEVVKVYQNTYGMQSFLPASSQQIIRVNGENGARSYQMAPNSSVLLLDESNPLVWLAQTDGAGYKTVTPYKIEPYHPQATPDLNDIMSRLQKLEDKMHESHITSDNRKNEQ